MKPEVSGRKGAFQPAVSSDEPTGQAEVLILVSSCLLGEPVRYDGGHAGPTGALLTRWQAEGRLVPFCPEVAGGLPVPRPPVEIEGGDGSAVLRGEAKVVEESGHEVTPHLLAGAREVLRQARAGGVELAILKDGSPSCGSSYIYDGSFRQVKRPGRGVTAALLEEHGIRVFSEGQIEQAAAYLSLLEES